MACRGKAATCSSATVDVSCLSNKFLEGTDCKDCDPNAFACTSAVNATLCNNGKFGATCATADSCATNV